MKALIRKVPEGHGGEVWVGDVGVAVGPSEVHRVSNGVEVVSAIVTHRRHIYAFENIQRLGYRDGAGRGGAHAIYLVASIGSVDWATPDCAVGSHVVFAHHAAPVCVYIYY